MFIMIGRTLGTSRWPYPIRFSDLFYRDAPYVGEARFAGGALHFEDDGVLAAGCELALAILLAAGGVSPKAHFRHVILSSLYLRKCKPFHGTLSITRRNRSQREVGRISLRMC